MEMKAYESFDVYLRDQSASAQKIIRALRKLVARVEPGLDEAVKYGNGCWLGDGRPVAYVYADKDHVQFGFLNGSSLKDPKSLLEGKARYVRHVKVRSVSAIDEKAYAALLRQAVVLGHPAKAGAKAAASRKAGTKKR